MSNSQEIFSLDFFKLESAGGIILMLAAVLALIFANTPLQTYYALILDTPVAIRIGAFEIAKPLLLWINDGLMAVFFFLVGLELKRELLEGELADRRNIILPGIGAIGGMAVPAAIYTFFNLGDHTAMAGWAIPAATDIAFALGVLMLLGSRVPTSIKIFLTSLAIFDDIGAILIIAVFYTAKISLSALILVACCIPLLLLFNRRRVESKSLYIMVGVVMWVAMLKSGVHATLAGVILALFIPMQSKVDPRQSPLKEMEHDLHSVVAFWILPIFAFANAGITLTGIGIEQLLHNVPVGIALGLFVGKQIGVFGFCWLAIRIGLTQLPRGISWSSLYGTAALCGIGFTMSLFIGSLAFEETDINLIFDERLGIILGSLASGLVGYLVLRRSLPASANQSH
ncbi:Na+/H+ antiporter NhaA [Sedimenticola hydrogenitrophicus]|uniref:Na+/H+ antiporter NhaA n=1 Tax=Sedimenticola hydrogenitrophicus TaxID=2967975 RepID=UPI0023B0E53D|nr:Na+/H+ antiporter NhaA [Sedimenticola hydrogenitrophicus]